MAASTNDAWRSHRLAVALLSVLVSLACAACTDVPVAPVRGGLTPSLRPASTTIDVGVPMMTSVDEAAPEAPTGPASPAREALRPSATYRLLVGHDRLEQPPRADARGVIVELSVPSRGWFLEQGAVVTGQVGEQPDLARVRALLVDTVAAGACDRLRRNGVDPGPTPMDLALAMSKDHGFDVLVPAERVTAFGHDGVHVVLQLHAQPHMSRCLDVDLATYRGVAWFGEIVELWIIDLDGRRVIIERSSFPQTSERVVYLLHVMIASVRILSS